MQNDIFTLTHIIQTGYKSFGEHNETVVSAEAMASVLLLKSKLVTSLRWLLRVAIALCPSAILCSLTVPSLEAVATVPRVWSTEVNGKLCSGTNDCRKWH